MTTPSRRALLAGTAVIAWAAFAVAAQSVTYIDVGFAENITVSQTGSYRISVGGANNGDPKTTGFGALVSGDIFMRSGSQYNVLVGGNGELLGGGGASMFTYAASRTAVGADRAIAGGGSGDGNPGLADPLGGGQGGASNGGGGGGGLYGYGQDGEMGLSGGAPLTGTALGGSARGYVVGGFGGGGGGLEAGRNIIDSNFGGGGGFTGGKGGYYVLNLGSGARGEAATGGGSYLSAAFANQIKTTGGATNGAFVSVDLIAPIPAPGALGLIGSAMAGLVLAARRRKRED